MDRSRTGGRTQGRISREYNFCQNQQLPTQKVKAPNLNDPLAPP